MLAAYRERHRLGSTMSAAPSHTSTESSINPNLRSAPTPYPPNISSYENNPFIQAQALRHQLTRAQVSAQRFGNHTTPPAYEQIGAPRSSDAEPRPPFNPPIPTVDEMRAAQLRHHDAMLSDMDHARFATGRRRPPLRDPAADQRPANSHERPHEAHRHRRSPHILESLLYGEEDGDDERPDSLSATLLQNSGRSSDQRPGRSPLDLRRPSDNEERPDSLNAIQTRNSRRSSDHRRSRQPLHLGRPGEATVARRRRENGHAALPQVGNPSNTRNVRNMMAIRDRKC